MTGARGGADLQLDDHTTATGRQIRQAALMVAVHPRSRLPAYRARDRIRASPRPDAHDLLIDHHLLNHHCSQLREQGLHEGRVTP